MKTAGNVSCRTCRCKYGLPWFSEDTLRASDEQSLTTSVVNIIGHFVKKKMPFGKYVCIIFKEALLI